MKSDLLEEMKKSVIESIKYLQCNLPLKDKFLAHMRYISPVYRENTDMPGALTFLAKELRRFSNEELENLSVQINMYQVLQAELVPGFDDDHDRLDHYWREIFKVWRIK